ncbi:PrsW family intramembrane metalloprotease [Nocardioides sp. BP30]|uniref:PrsW family intramembrane metalloprotease n=1 Tax=Nocardioides sp. BP30 TaxID=3036374 RepID=UPI00246956EA|nr:PrsW family intramembrane metalloprotease [Nocardioides sp. BP30]WGL52454.1 PrsW family intramembrane metalloprotease [Nocardioides sp. BP30]
MRSTDSTITDEGADAPETHALLTRRTDAIEESGWGNRFHLFQPRNVCLWIYLLLLAMGARQLYELAAPTAGVFAEANLAAVGSAGVFCLVFLLFLHHADRYERTPALLAVTAFVGGGIGAPWAMALSGNGALMNLYAKSFGQAWATDWRAGLSAPFVEETAKGAVFVLLLGLAPLVIRTVYDGLIVGAYVGLGFQVLEDMLYGQQSAYQSFGIHQVDSVLQTFVLRSATGVASHAMYTALFSAGVIYLVGTRAQPRRIGRGLLLALTAMVLHGVWDSMPAVADGNALGVILLMVLITVTSVVVLFVALRWGARRERGWLRDVLAPEVANGTITEVELLAVAGEREHRRRDRKAAVSGRSDGVTRRREKHVLAASLDLAHDLSTGKGQDTPQVEHSRAEIHRLRGR